jgi:hypothetical protein
MKLYFVDIHILWTRNKYYLAWEMRLDLWILEIISISINCKKEDPLYLNGKNS